jgi:hypothetical protein
MTKAKDQPVRPAGKLNPLDAGRSPQNEARRSETQVRRATPDPHRECVIKFASIH